MTAIRLMVVDDHAVLREGLRFMLRHAEGVEIISEASTGREAIGLLERIRPDVVLLDMNMPDMGGAETLLQIRERWPEISVLILSFHDDPEYVEQALRNGAAGYLLKTVSSDELVRAVHAAAIGAGYLQAEITRPVLQKFAATPQREADVELSPREREVLQLVADGMSTKQASVELGIAESTVKTYLRVVFDKLRPRNPPYALAHSPPFAHAKDGAPANRSHRVPRPRRGRATRP